ncbi:MAG: hypothetical protein JO142_03440 [Burkholderiales bacterium]|nr:hypothetical protein [Burkholderiales bacterium]
MQSHPTAPTEIQPVFIVHSPITYSLALTVMAVHQLDHAWLLGARGMQGARVNAAPPHDGGWSIEGCETVLKALLTGLPDNKPIALYLPHSLTLAAKLLALSPRVVAIYYLEEGYTATDSRLINHPVWFAQVDAGALLGRLAHTQILDALALDPDTVQRINQLPSYVFDGLTPKYAGAIACSIDAFPGLSHVHRVMPLGPSARLPAHLIAFPSLMNRYPTTTGVADQQMIQRNGEALHAIAVALLQAATPDTPVVIKLHPRDAVELPDALLERFAELGAQYEPYCTEHGVDPCLEPALVNFSHYTVFGRSALQKYVTLFQGAQRLSSPPLPF